jgi:hypothetical protein
MEPHAEVVFSKNETDLKRKNRFLVFLVSTAMITFTLGILAGLQLNRVRHIEENLIRYPDEKRPDFNQAAAGSNRTENRISSINNGSSGNREVEGNTDSVSFANRGVESASSDDRENGSFIIKVGVFDPDRAEALASRLNNLPEIAQTKPYGCRKISESIPDRYLSFRTSSRSTQGKQNVMIGCFLDVDSAREILDVVMKSGLSGTTTSRVYQID